MARRTELLPLPDYGKRAAGVQGETEIVDRGQAAVGDAEMRYV